MSDKNNGSYTERNQTRLRSKRTRNVIVSPQKERNLSIKKISRILRKDESKRTKEETELLLNYSEIVKEAAIRLEKREKLKERLKEVEDVESVIDEKCKKLAEAVNRAEYLVVYTGAGISTSARIPDYRGASGIWTLLQQGKDIGSHDLTQAEPTYTHMALSQLYLHGKLKHVVSQNCDGLHLRSGLPKRALSEVHGNMYIEVCRSCRPIVEYLRLFDVTEYTARYSHRTMRRCYKCNNPLVDSIVHFGERGNLPWPLNWKGACKAAEKADVILCMGSSLKVLKRYPWLWSMDKPAIRRPNLYIVNLQWTPKDYQAIIKINGRCDNVMKKVMKYLSINVPPYSRKLDPIFHHATALSKEEEHTTNRPLLSLVKMESAFLDDDPLLQAGMAEDEPLLRRESVKDAEPLDLLEIKIKSEVLHESENEDNIKLSSSEVKIKTEVNGAGFAEHVVTDTGQSEAKLKYVKEELILITIKSSEELEDCCKMFERRQGHDETCVNYIDKSLDIPVIMQDDLPPCEKIADVLTLPGRRADSCSGGEPRSAAGSVENGDQAESSNRRKGAKKREGAPETSVKTEIEAGEGSTGSKRGREGAQETRSAKKVKPEAKPPGRRKSKEDPKRTKCAETRKNPGKNAAARDNLCTFCSEQYVSPGCLFYRKAQPVFAGSPPHCECCDESEAEGDADEDEEEKCSKGKEAAAAAEEGEAKKELNKVINPGWYGKGIRKRLRRK